MAQIARTIARGLRLNEDLTEAAALGHDLGHTPFGHAGERALNAVFPGGFHHYNQSLRVVDRLEKNGRGLNLTQEVRDGIRCHTSGEEAGTLEGKIVRLADRIAYINHDIDDAMRGGVLRQEDLPDSACAILGNTKSRRINTLVISAILTSEKADTICLAPEIKKPFDELHSFMFEKVYTNPRCKGEEGKAIDILSICMSISSAILMICLKNMPLFARRRVLSAPRATISPACPTPTPCAYLTRCLSRAPGESDAWSASLIGGEGPLCSAMNFYRSCAPKLILKRLLRRM